MKLSLSNSVEYLTHTIKRFPLPTILCVLYFFAFRSVDAITTSKLATYVVRYLFLDVWVLLTFFALFFESEYFKNLTGRYRILKNASIAKFAITIFIISIYSFYNYYEFIFEPNNIHTTLYNFFLLKFVVTWSFFSLLLIAPYIKSQNTSDEQWYYQYIISLQPFIAILLTLIFLFGIYSLAWIIKYLFSVTISLTKFPQFCSMILFPMLFLAGIPRTFNEQPSKNEGRILKGFFENLIIPFLMINTVILYAYALMILVTWNMPKGSVFYLVSIFGGIGIFTHVALNYSKFKFNKLSTFFNKNFTFILLPLLGFMLFSLWQRINMYGLTEIRYKGPYSTGYPTIPSNPQSKQINIQGMLLIKKLK